MDNNQLAKLHDELQLLISKRLEHMSKNLGKLSKAIEISATELHPNLSGAELKRHKDFKDDFMSAASLHTQTLASVWVFKEAIQTLDKAQIAPGLYDQSKIFSNDNTLMELQSEALLDTKSNAESIIGNYKLMWPAMSQKYANELTELESNEIKDKQRSNDAIKAFNLGASI